VLAAGKYSQFSMEFGHKWALFAVALLFGGCPPPTSDTPPVVSTSAPSENPPEPAIPGSVCEHLSAGGGLDESAGAAQCPTPQVTADAVRIDWRSPPRTHLRRPSLLPFTTKNLLQEEIRVEYEFDVEGRHNWPLPIPPYFRDRTFSPGGGGVTEVNLQLPFSINAVEPDEPSDLVISARLLSPVTTEMEEISRVTFVGQLDERGGDVIAIEIVDH